MFSFTYVLASTWKMLRSLYASYPVPKIAATLFILFAAAIFLPYPLNLLAVWFGWVFVLAGMAELREQMNRREDTEFRQRHFEKSVRDWAHSDSNSPKGTEQRK